MSRIIFTTFTVALSILMVSLIFRLEEEQLKIETLSKKHREEIIKLEKIARINLWLETIVSPKIKHFSKNGSKAEYHLVGYFDNHAEKYRFQVERFIYNENSVKGMGLSYGVDRNSNKNLNDLITLTNPDGFMQFTSLKINKKEITGEIELIQPHNGNSGENNAS